MPSRLLSLARLHAIIYAQGWRFSFRPTCLYYHALASGSLVCASRSGSVLGPYDTLSSLYRGGDAGIGRRIRLIVRRHNDITRDYDYFAALGRLRAMSAEMY